MQNEIDPFERVHAHIQSAATNEKPSYPQPHINHVAAATVTKASSVSTDGVYENFELNNAQPPQQQQQPQQYYHSQRQAPPVDRSRPYRSTSSKAPVGPRSTGRRGRPQPSARGDRRGRGLAERYGPNPGRSTSYNGRNSYYSRSAPDSYTTGYPSTHNRGRLPSSRGHVIS